MGVRKFVTKSAKKAARLEAARLRFGAGFIDDFAPGAGRLSESLAKVYDKLGSNKKKKAKSKAGKRGKK
jgi:hypothetical protein